MSTNLHPLLNVAVRAARAAGSIINHAALDIEAVRVSEKHVGDFVTEVDIASEQAIIEILLDAYPQHGIWAEESGREHGNPNAEQVWIIDPLDGTRNFIHGYPVYCVSIALAVAGRVEQAVIYDPTRNDLYTATRGRGAYLNNRRMRVSKRTQLRDALLATGFPYRPGEDFDQFQEMMLTVTRRSSGMRRAGAAALDLAFVAAGHTEGYFETGLKPWDIAAGSLLVTEAGGLIGNFSGAADHLLEQSECLAATPRIFSQLVALLGPERNGTDADDKPARPSRRRAKKRLSLRREDGDAAPADAAPADTPSTDVAPTGTAPTAPSADDAASTEAPHVDAARGNPLPADEPAPWEATSS